jgi:stearoyl-CoA desaturase (delta-9 desaturase)
MDELSTSTSQRRTPATAIVDWHSPSARRSAAVGSSAPPSDVTHAKHPALDRTATAFVTLVPAALTVAAGAWAWGGLLHWQDLVILALMYVAVGLGVTVGFHRLLTHRSFRTHAWLRFTLAALGSAAIEGPVIEWVANHRKHHRFSDEEGDPHSPHVSHGDGLAGAARGLLHAHLGWVFAGPGPASEQRYAKDLLEDHALRFVDSTFLFWVIAGLAVPFGLGVALTGSVIGGLTGMLWGGAVRIFLLHHATFSINSLCHYFGHKTYATSDESRNLAWLALLTLGESWHNNHHAFPASARHGLRRHQLDPSALVIAALERLGLAWDVVRIRPEREVAKRLQQAPIGTKQELSPRGKQPPRASAAPAHTPREFGH